MYIDTYKHHTADWSCCWQQQRNDAAMGSLFLKNKRPIDMSEERAHAVDDDDVVGGGCDPREG